MEVTISNFESTEQTSLESLIIENPLFERIRHIDLHRTTPIDALVCLKELQDEVKKRKG